jgi:hypothetical protein
MSKAQNISWQLNNPIPDLIADKGDLVKFFGDARFLVPYAVQKGKTAHATLKLLFDLYDLSPVQKATVTAKSDFCFGNGIETMNGVNDTTKEFFDFLLSIGIDPSEVTDIARSCYRDEAVCGTTFLLARMTEVNGQWQGSIDRIPPTHCLPGYDFDGKSDFNNTILYNDKPIDSALYMTSGSEKYQSWKMIGKWPRITKSGKVFETVFQMNNVGYEADFWGRPTADTNWLYIDYQQANSTSKIAASEVLSKVLLLMKEPDAELLEQAGKSSEQVKVEITAGLRGTMTNRGAESQSLAAIFYDEVAPNVVQVGINRDYAYAESVRKMTVQNICAAHGIPASLVGLEQMNVGLGGTVVMDTLIKTNYMKIVPTQMRFSRMFNHVMSFFAGYTGFDIKAHAIQFVGPIQQMIGDLKSVRQKTSTTTADATNITQ